MKKFDYYPFGMLMPGRKYAAESGYQYGFNGKENDNEINGEGNKLDFGARIYDPRIGKWLSVDPLTDKYAMLTPFAYSADNPILLIDEDGRDWIISTTVDAKGNKTINIKLTAAIVNTSGTAVDLTKLKAAVIAQLKTNFEKISYEEVKSLGHNPNKSRLDGVKTAPDMIPIDFANVSVKFDADIRVVTNTKQRYEQVNTSSGKLMVSTDPTYAATRRPDEHLIEIKDDKDLPNLYAKVNKIGGKELYLNVTKVNNIISGSDNNTVFHELGHTLGLRHIDALFETFSDILGGNPQHLNSQQQAATPDNAMFSGGSGKLNDSSSTDLKPSQLKQAVKNYKEKKVNKN